MSYSIVQYTGDGATATWSVPFPYISKSDVSVKVAGVAATFTWPTTATVTITPTPANGAVIEIKRSTSPGSRVVDFGNGANLDEASLDNSALQMFYLAQETLDAVANAIALAADGKMDALSKVIKNVSAGVAGTDAINKSQLDAAILAPVSPDAANIANTPSGTISATNVQAALNELGTEKLYLAANLSGVNSIDVDIAAGATVTTVDCGSVAVGDLLLVDIDITINMGAANGIVTADILKSSGTATYNTTTPGTSPGDSLYCLGGQTSKFHFSTVLEVTASGTLVLALHGVGGTSPTTVPANKGGMKVRVVR